MVHPRLEDLHTTCLEEANRARKAEAWQTPLQTAVGILCGFSISAITKKPCYMCAYLGGLAGLIYPPPARRRRMQFENLAWRIDYVHPDANMENAAKSFSKEIRGI